MEKPADLSQERLTDRQVREKMAVHGVEGLSDAELLSILIREGVAGSTALDTAEVLLESYDGSLSQLSKADIKALRMVKSIGMSRASTLAAAFELAFRIGGEAHADTWAIKGSDDVVAMFRKDMGRLKYEEMWVLYLTSANSVIKKHRVSQGGVTSLIVDTKLIVKHAVEVLASSIILVHNHPSGMAYPSPEDKEITSKVAEAAAMFDVALIDHVIIAGDASYSFRQHSLIK